MEKNKSGVSAIPAPSSAQAGRDSATEVDPYNLLGKKGVLGQRLRAKDFEEVNNFDIEVCGYFGYHGHILGYVLKLMIAVTDPLDQTARSSK